MKVFHSNARVKENLLKNSFLIHAVPREGVVVVAILPLIAGDKDVDAAEAVGGNVALVIEGIDTRLVQHHGRQGGLEIGIRLVPLPRGCSVRFSGFAHDPQIVAKVVKYLPRVIHQRITVHVLFSEGFHLVTSSAQDGAAGLEKAVHAGKVEQGQRAERDGHATVILPVNVAQTGEATRQRIARSPQIRQHGISIIIWLERDWTAIDTNIWKTK